VLGRLSAEATDGGSLEPLAALTRELQQDAAAQAEARRELDALLGSPLALA
jgi:hypothetical protein